MLLFLGFIFIFISLMIDIDIDIDIDLKKLNNEDDYTTNYNKGG